MPGVDRPPALRAVLESARIAALQSYPLAEAATGEPFNTLVSMAAHLVHAPIAMISLIGRDQQWVKAAFGTEIQHMPRALSICNQTIAEPSGAMVVPDLAADWRFQSHPLVVSPPHIRFYAGVCLTDNDGYVLGTLCVMDTKPGSIEDGSLVTLHSMAGEATNALALQRAEQDVWQIKGASSPDWSARPALEQEPQPVLRESPAPGWLGVRTEHTPVPGTDREGRLLTSVAPNSPAGRANLLVGDIILSIGNRVTRRRNDITAAIADCAPGNLVRLQVWRNGHVFDCTLRLEALPREKQLNRRF